MFQNLRRWCPKSSLFKSRIQKIQNRFPLEKVCVCFFIRTYPSTNNEVAVLWFLFNSSKAIFSICLLIWPLFSILYLFRPLFSILISLATQYCSFFLCAAFFYIHYSMFYFGPYSLLLLNILYAVNPINTLYNQVAYVFICNNIRLTIQNKRFYTGSVTLWVLLFMNKYVRST